MGKVIEQKASDYIQVFNGLDWALRNKIQSMTEKDQADFIKMFKDFIYETIHKTLFNIGTEESEMETRKLCKYVIAKILPFLYMKINDLSKKPKQTYTKNDWELLDQWLNLDDDFKALASYRSLMHFAMYLETQDAEDNKVWCYNLDSAMGGVFYYANQMILNHKFQNMIKQCPTSYGKSKSDCDIICFILGYDIDASIMKIIGNPALLDEQFTKIVNMLKSPKFGKVFPQFGKYNGDDSMFRMCKSTEGKFILTESKAGVSFAIFNKKTSIDGTRFNYQFYDDVTQSNDKNNMPEHKRDIAKYMAQWRKRCMNENTVLRFFTGTAYNREDFLYYMRKDLANGKEWCVDMKILNKFQWARFCKISEDGKSVRILVQGLVDLELGEDKCYSSYPQKCPKDSYIKDMHGGVTQDKDRIRDFWAMTQQEPLPSESQAFDWAFLKQYDTLPIEIQKGECECQAIIDCARTGKDNFACLILKKKINEDVWYLVDGVYRQISSRTALPLICERLSYHKVGIINFENNATDEDLFEDTINANMISNNWKEYTINAFYSYKKKEEKIFANQDEIKAKIIFPRKGMYSEQSEMGKIMYDIVNYTLDKKVLHDDSIDCCAMFVDCLRNDDTNSIEALNIGRF